MNENVKRLLDKKIEAKENGTAIRTSVVRICYPQLFKPRGFEGSIPKYSVLLLIPKEDKNTMQALKSAHDKLVADTFSKNFKAKNPLIKDGDSEEFEHSLFNGYYVLRASSVRQPELVRMKNGNTIPLKEHEIKGGDWVIASISLFAYNQQANKGVSAWLNNLLLVAKDDAIGSTCQTAREDFEDLGKMEELSLDDEVNDLDDLIKSVPTKENKSEHFDDLF